MASSSTEICNVALSHLGVGKEIAALETEKSAEASACRRYYTPSLEATLRDFQWPFATKIVSLALIADNPNTEWRYSYQIPSDCLKVRRILSGLRTDTADTRIPYKLAAGAAGTVLYTDQQLAQIEYTYRATDPGRYPADFVMALSLRLAAYIAPRVGGSEGFALRKESMQLYQYEISTAEASALNEEQGDSAPDSAFIRARM